MKKTYTPSQKNIQRDWQIFDAQGQVLGRIATDIAKVLIGKNKAIYTPNINVGDKVVVINAAKVETTGNKESGKIYYRHTGYPGGIKSQTLEELKSKKPTEALRKAVHGMLPKNKLRKQRMANLYIYADDKHPHQAQFKDGNTNSK